MTWTAKPPDRPGWYGWLHYDTSAKHVVYLYELAFDLGLAGTFPIDGKVTPLSGWWGGLWWPEPLRLPWEGQP
jgi:hypothetical protein